jgi:hypothetical protein
MLRVAGAEHAGVFADADVATSSNQINIMLGLNACVDVTNTLRSAFAVLTVQLLVTDLCYPDPPLEVFDLTIDVQGFCQ